MSEKVPINYGGEQVELVRSESVYVEEGGERRRRDAANYFGILTKDDVKAWNDYKADPENFDMATYQQTYAARNQLRPVDESLADKLRGGVGDKLGALREMLTSDGDLDPKIEALLIDIKDSFEAERQLYQEEITALNTRLDDQQKQIDDLFSALEHLQDNGGTPEPSLDDVVEEDFFPGDLLVYERPGQEPEMGWVAISGVWAGRDDREYVTASREGQPPRHLLIDHVRSMDEPEPTPTEPTPVVEDTPTLVEDEVYERPRGSAWDRSRAWMGDVVTGRRAHAALIRERDGRRYRVIEEEIGPDGYVESDTRSGVRGMGILAVGMVAGAVLWELWEHKIHGHSTTGEFRKVVQQQLAAHEHADKVRHAAEMKAIAADEHLDKVHHAQEMNAMAKDHKQEMAYLHKLHNEHVHDHGHEMLAIHGNEFTNGHPNSYYHPNPHGASTGDFSSYKYPWDYTHNEAQLHVWATRAATAGHRVRWIVNAQGKEMLEVDGTKDTQKVLAVVTQYR